MNFIKNIIAGLILVALPMAGAGQIEFTEIKEENQWVEAVEMARETEKLIFLDIYATWCGPCKYLDKNVYVDEALGDYYNENFVNLKMDGETEFGAIMARKYSLSAYPTMYYMTPHESEITRIVGVREAAPLTSIGKTINENSERLEYYAQNYNSGKLNAMELKNYQALLTKTGQDEKAAEVANDIIPSLTEEEILSPDFKSIIINSSSDMDGKVYQVVSKNRDKLSESWSSQEIDQLFANIFNATLFRAISEKDKDLLDRILNEFLPVYMGENEAQLSEGIFATKKLYYANTGNWETYSNLVRDRYNELNSGDDTFLYRQAYEIANEYNQSTQAVQLSIDWMKMANEINPSFDNLVLTSFLYGMNTQYDEALKLVDRIREMEKSADQEKVLEELVNIIEEAQTE